MWQLILFFIIGVVLGWMGMSWKRTGLIGGAGAVIIMFFNPLMLLLSFIPFANLFAFAVYIVVFLEYFIITAAGAALGGWKGGGK